MKKIKRKPNPWQRSRNIIRDLNAQDGDIPSDTRPDRKEDFKNLTEEQKIRLRAAGYTV